MGKGRGRSTGATAAESSEQGVKRITGIGHHQGGKVHYKGGEECTQGGTSNGQKGKGSAQGGTAKGEATQDSKGCGC